MIIWLSRASAIFACQALSCPPAHAHRAANDIPCLMRSNFKIEMLHGMVNAMGCIKRNLNRFGAFAEICLMLCLATVAARAAQIPQPAKPAAKPDLGSNVLLFDPSMPSARIQEQIDKVYAIQQHSEFGSARYALLF